MRVTVAPAPGLWCAPAADDEQLAYSHAMAGAHLRAAEIYRRLLQKHPDDAHLRLMLGVCERNLGEVEKAKADLAEAGRKNSQLTPWTSWMTGIITLTSTQKEPPK